MKTILARANTDWIDARIKEILARGNIVRFTNKLSGITKDVNDWNPDDDGDLTAFRKSDDAKTNYVCPYAIEYEISEIENHETTNDN